MSELSTGLYQKHRPKTLKGLVGQPSAVAQVTSLLAKGFPHAILLVGSSGVGKTTLGRILARSVGCVGSDFKELNIADIRGIDNIRDIRSNMRMGAMVGSCRVWLLDEFHNATKEAMESILKMLEDTPEHVYFFLATTTPNKLLPTILTRCTTIRLEPVPEKDLTELVLKVAQKEDCVLAQSVADRIAECAEGSARQALVTLQSVMWLEGGEEAQLEAVQKGSVKQAAIDLARLLMNERTSWPEVAKLLKELEEDPETLRYMVLGYANSTLVGGKAKPGTLTRAYRVIQAFRFNFYDSKKAGLTAACWEVVST